LIFLLCINIVILDTLIAVALPIKILVTLICAVVFCIILVRQEKLSIDSKKLCRLNHGCKLVKLSGISAVAEIIILCIYIAESTSGTVNKIFSAVCPFIMLALTLFIGIIKITFNSKQVKIKDYIALAVIWWFPIVNIFLFRKFYKTAKRELVFETDRIELENARAENEVCKTKYPVLMVHGIFFRDWQYMNYWGRVPAALIRNGAEVYYGKQQSAGSIERSAGEIRDRIMEIIKETGAEKVNIIAHSKGGLDTRYALSQLGMDKYTATLTTINTPHEGCNMVDFLLEHIPQGFVDFVSEKYNRIFSALGDEKPDFLSGVNDLRASSAAVFNKKITDCPDVHYYSYMTIMSSAKSAFFPLNVSYRIIKKLDGDNDGLVFSESARHGEEYTLVSPKGKRGICHGDVIDLMRENIDGFDVREFYVGIISKLKERGF
jgi:triacylglycerol lipase